MKRFASTGIFFLLGAFVLSSGAEEVGGKDARPLHGKSHRPGTAPALEAKVREVQAAVARKLSFPLDWAHPCKGLLEEAAKFKERDYAHPHQYYACLVDTVSLSLGDLGNRTRELEKKLAVAQIPKKRLTYVPPEPAKIPASITQPKLRSELAEEAEKLKRNHSFLLFLGRVATNKNDFSLEDKTLPFIKASDLDREQSSILKDLKKVNGDTQKKLAEFYHSSSLFLYLHALRDFQERLGIKETGKSATNAPNEKEFPECKGLTSGECIALGNRTRKYAAQFKGYCEKEAPDRGQLPAYRRIDDKVGHCYSMKALSKLKEKLLSDLRDAENEELFFSHPEDFEQENQFETARQNKKEAEATLRRFEKLKAGNEEPARLDSEAFQRDRLSHADRLMGRGSPAHREASELLRLAAKLQGKPRNGACFFRHLASVSSTVEAEKVSAYIEQIQKNATGDSELRKQILKAAFGTGGWYLSGEAEEFFLLRQGFCGRKNDIGPWMKKYPKFFELYDELFPPMGKALRLLTALEKEHPKDVRRKDELAAGRSYFGNWVRELTGLSHQWKDKFPEYYSIGRVFWPTKAVTPLSPGETAHLWAVVERELAAKNRWARIRSELAKDPKEGAKVEESIKAQVKKQREEFERAHKTLTNKQKEALAPWLYRRNGEYFRWEIDLDSKGDYQVVFAPTDALKKLQFRQMMTLGAVRTGNPVSQNYLRSLPLSMPSTPEEAQWLWTKLGGKIDDLSENLTSRNSDLGLKGAMMDTVFAARSVRLGKSAVMAGGRLLPFSQAAAEGAKASGIFISALLVDSAQLEAIEKASRKIGPLVQFAEEGEGK